MKSFPKLIVFITGSFISHHCWDNWKNYFEKHGYLCLAPPWPYNNDTAENLRNHSIDTDIEQTNLKETSAYFNAIIQSLPEPPILIGHSIGGLIVQLLLQQGIGGAGIAIQSFPSYGMGYSHFSFLKASWVSLGSCRSSKSYNLIQFRNWKRYICNGFDCELQKQLYYKYAVPSSRQIIKDTFSRAASINFSSPHPPLLMLSGSTDRLVPASLNFRMYKKYKQGNSITDYKEFKGRNHFLFEHPAWKDEAAYILYWLHGF